MTTLMPSMRSRKLDNKKHLAVYKHTDIPDLDENASINRIAAVVATGVEKEEEEEHHLQVALHSTTAEHQYIPTPDASKLIDDYEEFYDASWQQPHSFIRFSSQVEDCIGCGYNADKVDIDWLIKCKDNPDFPKDQELSELDYEIVIACLERLANEKVFDAFLIFQISGECPTLFEFQGYLEIENPDVLRRKSFFPLIYQWWKHRRFTIRKGKMITPQLKMEELIGFENDSYVCFRRREVKTMRKTRRCDTASLDKLRRLRDEMKKAREILELVTRRERLRKELLGVEIQVFEARIKVRRMKQILGIETVNNDIESSPEKPRRPRSVRTSSTRIKIPLGRFRDAAYSESAAEPQLVEDRIKRRRHLDEKEGWADFTEFPFLPQPPCHPSHNFWTAGIPVSLSGGGAKTVPSAPYHSSGRHDYTLAEDPPVSYRCRVGRGGRRMLDRHIRRSQWLPEETAAGNDTGTDSYISNRWRFDCDDDEVEQTVVELEENARAFNLAPVNEQECRSLMNKPHFQDQINVTPHNHPQRALAQTQAAERAVSSPAPIKKRAARQSTGASVAEKLAPKKKIPELNPRDAAVKAMMQQAQKKALSQLNTPRNADGSIVVAIAPVAYSSNGSNTGRSGSATLSPKNTNLVNASQQHRFYMNRMPGQANGTSFNPQMQQMYYGQQMMLQQQLASRMVSGTIEQKDKATAEALMNLD